MHNYALRLEQIITQVTQTFRVNSTTDWQDRPAPGKWSKKEILGHLCDSAFNNIQRFVRGTHEQDFKLVYHQDDWVAAQHWHTTNIEDIFNQWRLANHRIAVILKQYPQERQHIRCDVGKAEPQYRDMDFLAGDYLGHLEHHLRQLFSGLTDFSIK